MNPTTSLWLLCCMFVAVSAGTALAASKPETPKVESIELAPVQPHEGNKSVIWYDNFDKHDAANWKYHEPSADKNTITRREALGGKGGSMELFYPKGKKGGGTGNRKLAFGDSPIGRPIRKGEQFTDVYWRIYVKHQKGWTGGGPAKMSRAMIMVSNRWNQAMISHVWGSGERLTLDPVRAVSGTRVLTKKYNDWPGLKWLGNKPVSKFPIHATEESGRWVCVEARAKLNTPGKSDGYNALWIDGVLQCDRKNMNFRGSYTAKGINAVFLEAYWNRGSPVDQYRWYDDFVVSTKPIGPLTARANPTLIKTPLADCAGWEAQIAAGAAGAEVLWRSRTISGNDKSVKVAASTGSFAGKAEGASALTHGPLYFCRVRQMNRAETWSDWSGWHQPFQVDKNDKGTSPEGKSGASDERARKTKTASNSALSNARKAVRSEAGRARRAFLERIVRGVKGGRKPRISIDMNGMSARGRIKSADDKGLVLSMRGAEIPIDWDLISKQRFAGIAEKYAGDSPAERLQLAVLFVDAGRLDRAADHLRAAGKLPGKNGQLAREIALLIRTH